MAILRNQRLVSHQIEAIQTLTVQIVSRITTMICQSPLCWLPTPLAQGVPHTAPHGPRCIVRRVALLSSTQQTGWGDNEALRGVYVREGTAPCRKPSMRPLLYALVKITGT